MPATNTSSPRALACAHCGLPVPAGLESDGGEAPAFCCSGCATVWHLLHEHGLERFYAIPNRRGAAVTPSGRPFEEFDHPAFDTMYVTAGTDGTRETELYLEGVHCAACVWLVEHLPRTVHGLARAELDLGRSRARIWWRPEETTLSAIARFLDTIGYRPHPYRRREADALRRREDREMVVRLGVAGALAANAMLLGAALYSGWFAGMEPVYERYFRWMSLIVVTPAILWPGGVFFRGAWRAVRARTLQIDVPIALALGAGYGRGLWNTITGQGPIYFDGLAVLVFLLLTGRYLQQRAQRKAVDASELLASLAPATARVLTPNGAQEIPVEAVLPEMRVAVRPGEPFPADGIVEAGRSEINAALLSGESRPAGVSAGSEVWAGTVNLTAPLTVRVTEAGETTRLARILRDVDASLRTRTPVVQAADRAARWFVAAVLLLAGVTVAVWWRTDQAAAIDHAIAMLIVTCPCALALATPLAMSVAIGRAARAGILIKGGAALETLARAPGTVVLDKTGTLTQGDVLLVAWDGPDHLRPLILGLEAESPHPLAGGFRRAWPGVVPFPAAGVRATAGGGLEGVVGGHALVIGAPRFVAERIGAAIPAFPFDPELTPVLIAVDGAVAAQAAFGDPIRPDAVPVVTDLERRGWTVRMLSGDVRSVVEAVGTRLGLSGAHVAGGAGPEAKAAAIRVMAPRPVVMVGDGVNDAGAMAAADVGVGVRGGAEACLAVADVFLNRPGLQPLLALVDGAERTLRVIRANLAFSIAYNVVGAALALGGFLHPLVAAVLMPVSSLTVIVHSWRRTTFEVAA